MFCKVGSKVEEGGEGDVVVIANLRSLSMERLVMMKTSRGISFFPGVFILLFPRKYLLLTGETRAEK